jgi:hypothetical protein
VWKFIYAVRIWNQIKSVSQRRPKTSNNNQICFSTRFLWTGLDVQHHVSMQPDFQCSTPVSMGAGQRCIACVSTMNQNLVIYFEKKIRRLFYFFWKMLVYVGVEVVGGNRTLNLLINPLHNSLTPNKQANLISSK